MPLRDADALPPGWTLLAHITLEVEQDEHGDYIVSDHLDNIFCYGVGATLDAARRDYWQSLTELYEMFADDVAQGINVLGRLDLLQTYLRPPASE